MIEHAFPWLPWGEAAFERAREQHKYVLLHIGATWCHWCHVMDEGSYTHPAVERLVRERFVAVRVDTDERPDVNERYNQGGWPTMAVLDADGEVLLGRTYVSGGELAGLLGSIDPARDRWVPARATPRPPAPASVDAIRAAVDAAWDDRDAGFGDGEKFPHPTVCEWLLDRALRGDTVAGDRLARTLDAMTGRGLVDPDEGGFFRYATQSDWTEPHYEKLLEDQARLVSLLLRADAWRPTPRWRDAAVASIRWSLRTLWDDRSGAFGGSQDADEGYHRLPLPSRGPPPPVDPTLYAGWNGRMIDALVRSSAALGRPGLLGLARRAGETIRTLVDPDGRVTRFRRGKDPAEVAGLLEDQVGVAAGFLALAQALGGDWLDDTIRTLTWARDHLASPTGPGWLDRPPGGIGRLAEPSRPVHGNAALAEVCVRLAAVSGDSTWRSVAATAAEVALSQAGPWGFMGAPAAAARERIDAGTVVVKVHGRPDLRDAVLRDPRPELTAAWLDEGSAAALGVPTGAAMACTDRACARPSRDLPELERALTMLLPAPERGAEPPT